MTTENRHFHRVLFDCFVQFNFDEYEHICELVDISLNGALIAACTGATPEAGTPCTLIISLDDEKTIQIIMQGKVAHKIENRVGIHCESIDLDSITNLRNLIKYNLDDPELIDRDLDELGQLN